jgi:hypothetical protein
MSWLSYTTRQLATCEQIEQRTYRRALETGAPVYINTHVASTHRQRMFPGQMMSRVYTIYAPRALICLHIYMPFVRGICLPCVLHRGGGGRRRPPVRSAWDVKASRAGCIMLCVASPRLAYISSPSIQRSRALNRHQRPPRDRPLRARELAANNKLV